MSAGYSIQYQAWSLVPRIREIDEFVREFTPGEHVRETHPEVCFAALNGGESLTHAKDTDDGQDERLELLNKKMPEAQIIFSDSVELYTLPEYAPVVSPSSVDDILDAMVAATVAIHWQHDFATLPKRSGGQYDEILNREIEMVFPGVE